MSLEVQIDGEWHSIANLQTEAESTLRALRNQITEEMDTEEQNEAVDVVFHGVALARINSEIERRREAENRERIARLRGNLRDELNNRKL